MSPERTDDDGSLADAPDWFEAEDNGDASGDPSSDGDDWLDDVAALVVAVLPEHLQQPATGTTGSTT